MIENCIFWWGKQIEVLPAIQLSLWLHFSLAQGETDCSSVTEGALLVHQLNTVFRKGFWVAKMSKNWVTRRANIHQPPKLFLHKLSSAVSQVCLLTQNSC